jgi:hypothetical protein
LLCIEPSVYCTFTSLFEQGSVCKNQSAFVVSVLSFGDFFFVIVQTVLPACYQQLRDTIRDKLRSRGVEVSRLAYIIENSCALTSDCWTDPALRSFIVATISWIDDRWMMHSEMLNIHNCTDRHSGDNLAEWLVGLLNDMQIDVSS